MAETGPMVSKVYNQHGKGLTVVDKYGESTSVANVSCECFRSIVSTDNSQFGYVWKVNKSLAVPGLVKILLLFLLLRHMFHFFQKQIYSQV